jgi:glyoxylase-like metal-dependent hydrolase (beta-lactamase superfamily II)
VQDVIITHLHYDHCGNDALFPAARYHLQEAEMAFATGRCMCHPVMRHSFEIEDVVAMLRRVYAGRVAFHDGADEIAPGVTVHHIGGHSRGLQAVRVNTRRGWVVLASDVVHFYAHLDQRRPYVVIDSLPAMLEGFDTVDRLATSRDHVVPGHDPLVTSLYPAARPGTEGWAVRLDADPRPR